MGVRGLTTYVRNNQDVFLKEHNLHNTNLVIDGNSLAAQLYCNSRCFSAFGGDYDKYATYVKTFFKGLKKCNITSYVIFDGSYEKRKLKTVCERLRNKISGASRLDPITQSSLQIFPLLLRYVFKEALKAVNVPWTVCEFEADNEIAAMSRKLGCPVLSLDSDFFIFNVIYIPFNTLDYKPVAIKINGENTHVIQCKLFRVPNLVNNIGIKEEMLPLLATLLGNDYVQKRVFKEFFSQLKLPKTKQNKNDEQRTIQALFSWLKNETLESAVAKIIGRLKKNAKNRVLYILKKSIEGYNCTECPSLKYFNFTYEKTKEINKVTTSDVENFYGNNGNENKAENSTDDEDSSDDNGVDPDIMPEWFSNYLRREIVPVTYLNLYTLHIHFSSPQAEDYTDEDANICVLTILRYAFDILTDYSEESFTFISRENNNQYKRILVGREYAISRPIDKKYSQMPVEELKIYFQHFLKEQLSNLELTTVELLPSNFRLAMLSLLWWVSRCRVTLGNVHSLLLSYIMLDCLDGKTGMFRGHHFFNNKFAKNIEDLKNRPVVSFSVNKDNLFLNKNKVSYEDSLIACSVLLEHFELSNEIRKKPKSYNHKIMHRFAQFQCTLLQFNCLNCLSNNLYESTIYSKFFNGTFVYNLAVKLENQINPVSFVDQYLKGASTVISYYKSLCFVLDRCVEQLGLQFEVPGKRRRRKKRGNEVDENVSFLAKEFASEVFI